MSFYGNEFSLNFQAGFTKKEKLPTIWDKKIPKKAFHNPFSR